MRIKILIVLAILLTNYVSKATIICPPDKNLTCYDDIHHLPLVGVAEVWGGSGQLRYIDRSNTDMCNVGHIIRTWYLDANGNQSFDNTEEACVQNLYVAYSPGTVDITWPRNLTVECTDDIPNESPFWTSGPCDMIGLSKNDEILKTGNASCYKILRHFTLINWCTAGQSGVQSEWKYTQMITINDNTLPVIKQCGDVIIGVDGECKGTFTVSNSATDVGLCGEQFLIWKAEVDLWNDGIIDYVYSSDNLDQRFKLKTTKSGESLSFTLPERVQTGWHYVKWTASDYCGNATSCIQKVNVKDTKKPTPYLYEILSAAFEGNANPLRVNAKIFNHSSFDNCTKASLLKYSFSKDVNDSIRIINCNNAGFQFFNIYVTDLEGNQDFAEVYLLAFDNGACGQIRNINGVITESNGAAVSGATFTLSRISEPHKSMIAISNISGDFEWENIAIFEDMTVTPNYEIEAQSRVDIADFKMAQDYIMGRLTLVDNQLIAADVDGDGQIRARDLIALRDIILGKAFTNHWILTNYMDSIRQQDQLTDVYRYSNVRLDDLKSPLHFKAIYSGDISDANSQTVETRNKHVVNKIKIDDQSVAYFVENEQNISGVQLEITGITNQNVQLSSPYFDIPATSVHIQDGRLRLVIVKDVVLDPAKPLIVISEINQSEEVFLSNTSKLLLPTYNTINLIERTILDKTVTLEILPNPINDYFELSEKSAHVLDIRTAAGTSVSFTQKDRKVILNGTSGLYFVVIQNGGQIIVKKTIKL